jgi:hypothetical protein
VTVSGTSPVWATLHGKGHDKPAESQKANRLKPFLPFLVKVV